MPDRVFSVDNDRIVVDLHQPSSAAVSDHFPRDSERLEPYRPVGANAALLHTGQCCHLHVFHRNKYRQRINIDK